MSNVSGIVITKLTESATRLTLGDKGPVPEYFPDPFLDDDGPCKSRPGVPSRCKGPPVTFYG
ncbi:acinetodin/klebsidin/J25 family lasso peptide [Phyllobacterium zundukense]|uniref:acinetodin/klebsidin/J25 family lasso peptide n=1 Tax=Phyllobacterium zundukense TaxID=1867719 RepID=UPI003965B8E8